MRAWAAKTSAPRSLRPAATKALGASSVHAILARSGLPCQYAAPIAVPWAPKVERGPIQRPRDAHLAGGAVGEARGGEHRHRDSATTPAAARPQGRRAHGATRADAHCDGRRPTAKSGRLHLDRAGWVSLCLLLLLRTQAHWKMSREKTLSSCLSVNASGHSEQTRSACCEEKAQGKRRTEKGEQWWRRETEEQWRNTPHDCADAIDRGRLFARRATAQCKMRRRWSC